MAKFAEEHNRKRKEVEQEIENHGKTWCNPGCTSFVEHEYRRCRMISDMSAEETQNDYQRCHVPQIKPS